MNEQPALRRLMAIFLFLLLLAGQVSGQAATAVYEPPTSLALPATILWQADAGAIGVAKGSARPASALVYLDAALQVLTDSGELISPSLKVYLEATSQGMIPALYVRDQAVADALYGSLQAGPWRDLLVAAPPEGGAWVARLCSLPQVHGLIDLGIWKARARRRWTGSLPAPTAPTPRSPSCPRRWPRGRT
ncbi:MAG: hypothetical protein AB9880_09235 [Christensenellales bacterium]